MDKTPKFGCVKGQIIMSPDFDDPVDDFKEYNNPMTREKKKPIWKESSRPSKPPAACSSKAERKADCPWW